MSGLSEIVNDVNGPKLKKWSPNSQNFKHNKHYKGQSRIILTETSHRTAVKGVGVDLFPHQESLVYAMSKLEADVTVRFAGLVDPPGVGKTFAILGMVHLALHKRQTGTTLIVTPSNITSQWESYISRFSNNKLRTKRLIDYESITGLNFNEDSLQRYDILLTTAEYLPTIAKTMLYEKFNVHRIVLDEIDSIERFVDSDMLPANKVWFVSASYVPHQKIPCLSCDPRFVKQSIELPPTVSEIIKCEEPYLDILLGIMWIFEEQHEFNPFKGVDLERIDAYDFSTVNFQYSNRRVTSFKELVSSLHNHLVSGLEISAVQMGLYKADADQLGWFAKMNDVYTRYLQDLDLALLSFSSETGLTKLGAIKNLITGSKKTLIFSDWAGSFQSVEKLLDNLGVEYAEIIGDSTSLVKTLDRYRNDPELKVLLINAERFGAGLNLENTELIILMHGTRWELQVVGRAQRIGRVAPLKVVHLSHV